MSDFVNTPQEETNSGGFDFQDAVYLCISKWYWFVISIVLCLSIGVLQILRTTPVYTRYATLMIKDVEGRKGSIEQQISELGGYSASNVNNEVLALQSPAITEEVVKRLHLDVNYSIDGVFHNYTLYGRTLPIEVKFLSLTEDDDVSLTIELDGKGNYVMSEFKGPRTKPEDEGKSIRGRLHSIINTPVGRILVDPSQNFYDVGKPIHVHRTSIKAATGSYNRVGVSLMEKQSNMLRLVFNDVNTQRAEDVINTTIEVYNENWIDDKNQIAVSTSQFINERLRVIESELGSVDHSISSYKSANMIPDAETAASSYMSKADATGDRLLDLNNQLYMAKYVRQMVSDEREKFELLPANSGINSTSVEQLIAEYNENILLRNRLLSNMSVNSPLIADLESRINNQRQVIVQSIDNFILTLNTQAGQLKAQEQQLNSKIANTPVQSTYLTSIGREQKVKESLYIFLLQKREENELSMAFTAYNTRLITPPTGSNAPTSPVKRNILFLALCIAIVVPLLVIIIRELMNTTVRGRRDLEGLTVPYIGEIPMSYKSPGFFQRIVAR